MLNTFQQIPHAMLPEPTPDEAARQEFAKSLKQFVQQGLLPGLQPIFKGRASQRFEQSAARVETAKQRIQMATAAPMVKQLADSAQARRRCAPSRASSWPRWICSPSTGSELVCGC